MSTYQCTELTGSRETDALPIPDVQMVDIGWRPLSDAMLVPTWSGSISTSHSDSSSIANIFCLRRLRLEETLAHTTRSTGQGTSGRRWRRPLSTHGSRERPHCSHPTGDDVRRATSCGRCNALQKSIVVRHPGCLRDPTQPMPTCVDVYI